MEPENYTRIYDVVERCRCGNEARHTTSTGTRLCGICVVDAGCVAIADNRVAGLLRIVDNMASNVVIVTRFPNLVEEVRALIGRKR